MNQGFKGDLFHELITSLLIMLSNFTKTYFDNALDFATL